MSVRTCPCRHVRRARASGRARAPRASAGLWRPIRGTLREAVVQAMSAHRAVPAEPAWGRPPAARGGLPREAVVIDMSEQTYRWFRAGVGPALRAADRIVPLANAWVPGSRRGVRPSQARALSPSQRLEYPERDLFAGRTPLRDPGCARERGRKAGPTPARATSSALTGHNARVEERSGTAARGPSASAYRPAR